MSLDVEIREAALERAAGRCEIKYCTVKRPRLEVAHLRGKGAGGSKFRDALDNLAVLCHVHHDLLDGRLMPNGRRFELEMVYRAALNREWIERR